jgi:hypothetical protein
MSRTPDLSAFPIPRKGGAKPIVDDEAEEAAGGQRGGEGRGSEPAEPVPSLAAAPEPETAAAPRASGTTRAVADATTPSLARTAPAIRPSAPLAVPYGQIVATTVKLDESRYLRLVEAGKPGPGRLKRRTTQDMLIEALDEWFERRGL